jgi:acid phosphatase class B
MNPNSVTFLIGPVSIRSKLLSVTLTLYSVLMPLHFVSVRALTLSVLCNNTSCSSFNTRKCLLFTPMEFYNNTSYSSFNTRKCLLFTPMEFYNNTSYSSFNTRKCLLFTPMEFYNNTSYSSFKHYIKRSVFLDKVNVELRTLQTTLTSLYCYMLLCKHLRHQN